MSMLEDGNKCRIGELIKWVSNWGMLQNMSMSKVSVNNLRDIIIWANNDHKSANCILDDLLGSSCLSCPFCVSDNLPKCASSDKLFDTLEWGNGVRYVWHTRTKRFNGLDEM